MGEILGERRRVNLKSIVEGIEFIWIQRIILSLFLLDFAVVLVGFYRPILPILPPMFSKPARRDWDCSMPRRRPDRLSAPRSCSWPVTSTAKASSSSSRLYFLPVHSLARSVAMVLDGGHFSGDIGMADSVSVAIRRTVVQLLAPDGMLGRAASLITVFAQTTNGLGALLAGIAAQYMGASNALLVGSGLCFLMILGICIAIPQLWRKILKPWSNPKKSDLTSRVLVSRVSKGQGIGCPPICN